MNTALLWAAVQHTEVEVSVTLAELQQQCTTIEIDAQVPVKHMIKHLKQAQRRLLRVQALMEKELFGGLLPDYTMTTIRKLVYEEMPNLAPYSEE